LQAFYDARLADIAIAARTARYELTMLSRRCNPHPRSAYDRRRTEWLLAQAIGDLFDPLRNGSGNLWISDGAIIGGDGLKVADRAWRIDDIHTPRNFA
jgi:hypothetical protein